MCANVKQRAEGVFLLAGTCKAGEGRVRQRLRFADVLEDHRTHAAAVVLVESAHHRQQFGVERLVPALHGHFGLHHVVVHKIDGISCLHLALILLFGRVVVEFGRRFVQRLELGGHFRHRFGTVVINAVLVLGQRLDDVGQFGGFDGAHVGVAEHVVERVDGAVTHIGVEALPENGAFIEGGVVALFDFGGNHFVQSILIGLGVVEQRFEELHSGNEVFLKAGEGDIHLVAAGKYTEVNGELVKLLVDLLIAHFGSADELEVVDGQGQFFVVILTHVQYIIQRKEVVDVVFNTPNRNRLFQLCFLDVFVVIEKNRRKRLCGRLHDGAQEVGLRFAVHLYRVDGGFFYFLGGFVFAGEFINHRVVVAEPFVGKIHHVLLGDAAHGVYACHIIGPGLAGNELIVQHKGHVHSALLLLYAAHFQVVDGSGDEVFLKIALFQIFHFHQDEVAEFLQALALQRTTAEVKNAVVFEEVIEPISFQYFLLLHQVFVHQAALAVVQNGTDQISHHRFLRERAGHYIPNGHAFFVGACHGDFLYGVAGRFRLKFERRHGFVLPVAEVLVH